MNKVIIAENENSRFAGPSSTSIIKGGNRGSIHKKSMREMS